jgi:hypothetical protein
MASRGDDFHAAYAEERETRDGHEDTFAEEREIRDTF